MAQYCEFLHLKSLGFSNQNIAHSCSVSRNTVATVIKKAAEINLSWPFDIESSNLRSAGVSLNQPMRRYGCWKRRSKNEPVLMVYRIL